MNLSCYAIDFDDTPKCITCTVRGQCANEIYSSINRCEATEYYDKDYLESLKCAIGKYPHTDNTILTKRNDLNRKSNSQIFSSAMSLPIVYMKCICNGCPKLKTVMDLVSNEDGREK